MLSYEELCMRLRRSKSMKYAQRRNFVEMLLTAIERPIVPDLRFMLGDMNDADAELKFRFDVQGIRTLVSLLRVPSVFLTQNRDRCHGEEALCIVLNRLSYPRRYVDMMALFGRSRESISRIFNGMVDFLFSKWHHLLFFCKSIVVVRLDKYTAAIAAKGAPLDCVFGFIDGSKIQTCRIAQPTKSCGHSDMQRYIYSGHKRMHCLNFQAITAPDGLCIHFWGPLEGSRHDTTLLRESKLLGYLHDHTGEFDGYFIYGDPAYGVLRWIFSGYKGNNLTDNQKAFNTLMSKVRHSVEWTFGRMKMLWGAITYKMQQKIMLQNVGKVVQLAMLLTNCHCCQNGGNQISSFFNLRPPTLAEYLHL